MRRQGRDLRRPHPARTRGVAVSGSYSASPFSARGSRGDCEPRWLSRRLFGVSQAAMVWPEPCSTPPRPRARARARAGAGDVKRLQRLQPVRNTPLARVRVRERGIKIEMTKDSQTRPRARARGMRSPDAGGSRFDRTPLARVRERGRGRGGEGSKRLLMTTFRAGQIPCIKRGLEGITGSTIHRLRVNLWIERYYASLFPTVNAP